MIKGVTSGGSAAVVRTLDHSTLEVHWICLGHGYTKIDSLDV